MQTYEVGPVTLILERNSSFTTVSMEFTFALDFDSIVPDTEEEAVDYHNSIARTVKFLQGINNAFILETDYPETELFVTQRINNVSIEVPEGCNKIPLIGQMLFKKVKALMGNFDVESFSLEFYMNEPSSDKLKTKLEYTDESVEGTKLDLVLGHYETEWTEEMVKDHEELKDQQIDISDEEPTTPWWNRNDGQVRDFINMDIESFEDFQDQELTIRILTVDLEDEDVMIIDDDFETDDDDPEPDTPDTTDNGYYKF